MQTLNAQDNKKSKLLTSFKFDQFLGGVINFKAQVGDRKDTLMFILDTGSSGISLDSTTAARLNFFPRLSDTLINGIGGIKNASYLFDLKFKLNNLITDSLNFHVVNYNELEPVYGQHIDGIVGYQFFNKYIVDLNYDSNVCKIYSPGKISYPSGGHFLNTIFSYLPMTYAAYEESVKLSHHFYVDIGAGINFLISENLARDSSVFSNGKKLFYTQVEGVGGQVNMKLGVIKNVKIGKYKFRKVPTYVYDDKNNITGYPVVGGLIGNDLLRRFNVIFNYPDRKIHIKPNSHFGDLFDYAYTGLSIYEIDKKIIVDDIIPKSPADIAGLKIGDEIVSINTIFANVQKLRDVLQSVTNPSKIIYLRGVELLETILYPLDIRTGK